VSWSASCAARTVLAAGGGYSPVDRHAWSSSWAWRCAHRAHPRARHRHISAQYCAGPATAPTPRGSPRQTTCQPLLSELREPKQRIQLKRRRSPSGSTHNSQAGVGAGNRPTLRLDAYLPAGTAPAGEHSMSRTRSAEREADSATQQVSAVSRVGRCDGWVPAAPVGVRVSCRGYARSRSMAVARDWVIPTSTSSRPLRH
jgi:hypothetical protein